MSIQKILEDSLVVNITTSNGIFKGYQIYGIPEAAAEIETLRQSEVCENCQSVYEEILNTFDGKKINNGHKCEIRGYLHNYQRQSCLDFKRKEE